MFVFSLFFYKWNHVIVMGDFHLCPALLPWPNSIERPLPVEPLNTIYRVCVRRVASLASSRSASTLFRYRPSLSRALRNTVETFHAYRPLHTDRANIHDFSIYFYLSFLLLWNFGKSNFPELGEMEGKTNWNCAFQRKFRSSVQMYTIRGILIFGSDTELTRN